MKIHLVAPLALALSVVGCTESSPSDRAPAAPAAPSPVAAPSALDAAHAAYLSGDYLTVGDRIRDVLLDPGAGRLARENALELLDASYEATRGKMPSRLVLPPEIKNPKLGVVHGKNAGTPYGSVFLYVRVPEGMGARIAEMTVRRLPGEVVLDRASAKLSIRHDAPGFEDVVLERVGADGPFEDGVYSMRVAIDGGPVAEGWFLARRMVSSAVPEIASPTHQEVLSDPNPTIRWTPFRSPEYATWEQRVLSVYVGDAVKETQAWNLWTDVPGEIGAVRVGLDARAPKTTLAPGSYWLALSGSEERMFGPLRLSRNSRSGVPFSVVR